MTFISKWFIPRPKVFVFVTGINDIYKHFNSATIYFYLYVYLCFFNGKQLLGYRPIAYYI